MPFDAVSASEISFVSANDVSVMSSEEFFDASNVIPNEYVQDLIRRIKQSLLPYPLEKTATIERIRKRLEGSTAPSELERALMIARIRARLGEK